MAKLSFEMSWNYTEEQYNEFLKENDLVHLKTHGEKYFKVGDALRSSKGVIARIMERFSNYENLSIDYTIANNNLSKEEMYSQFIPSVQVTVFEPTSNGFYYGTDRDGNTGFFEDYEQSIGEA